MLITEYCIIKNFTTIFFLFRHNLGMTKMYLENLVRCFLQQTKYLQMFRVVRIGSQIEV